MTPIPARSISLAEFRAAPASILGSAIDTGEVILIGYDPTTEGETTTAKPLAVMVSYDLWLRMGGTEVSDDATTNNGDAANRATEPDTAKPVPVAGQPGWWCCSAEGCAGITEDEGGKCGECEPGESGGIYLEDRTG